MSRIALVEDEELISTMIRLNLELEGYAVQPFANAEAMLDACTGGEVFNLILLDIMLPGMSGEDALVALRERGVETPVMMLTAKSDVETRISALQHGADDYLPKPFNVGELIARVKALLRRVRPGSGEGA